MSEGLKNTLKAIGCIFLALAAFVALAYGISAVSKSLADSEAKMYQMLADLKKECLEKVPFKRGDLVQLPTGSTFTMVDPCYNTALEAKVIDFYGKYNYIPDLFF